MNKPAFQSLMALQAEAAEAMRAKCEAIARQAEDDVIDNEHYDPGAIRETARDIANAIAALSVQYVSKDENASNINE